jgi:hypothetical protein
MSNENDLIRRGDAMKALDWGDIYGSNAQDAIAALPAAPMGVNDEAAKLADDCIMLARVGVGSMQMCELLDRAGNMIFALAKDAYDDLADRRMDHSAPIIGLGLGRVSVTSERK